MERLDEILLQKVNYFYPNAKQPALSGINLSIKKGELVLLAGPTGSGKSTLAFILMGVIPEVIGGNLEGNVSIFGSDPTKGTSELTGKVGFVAQNFENELFGMQVREGLAFGPLNKSLSRKETKKRVDNLISTLELEGLEDRYSFNLSRGEQQKVIFGSMLALNPDLLILDEPLAHLDRESKVKVIQLLEKLHKERDLSILVIEHEVRLVRKIAQRLVLLNQGKIAYDGEPSINLNILKDLGLRIGQELKQLEFKDRRVSAPILSTVDLTCRRGNKKVLKGISFEIKRGEIVGIVGPNGAGKTTLALTLADLLPFSGEINRNGNVSMVFQNPEENLVYHSVWEEVYQPARNKGQNKEEARKTSKKILKRLDLYKFKNRNPQALSQGQKLRLAFASALSLQPDLLIFDEPTFGQDFKGLQNIFSLLTSYTSAVLICTNHGKIAQALSDRILQLEGGKVVERRAT